MSPYRNIVLVPSSLVVILKNLLIVRIPQDERCLPDENLQRHRGTDRRPAFRQVRNSPCETSCFYAGHIVIADQPKPDAKEAIVQLKAMGVKKTVMLTGDTKEVLSG